MEMNLTYSVLVQFYLISIKYVFNSIRFKFNPNLSESIQFWLSKQAFYHISKLFKSKFTKHLLILVYEESVWLKVWQDDVYFDTAAETASYPSFYCCSAAETVEFLLL